MQETKLQGRYEYTVSSEENYSTSLTKLEDGLDLIQISWKTADGAEKIPPVITLAWEFPHDNIQGLWHPCAGTNRGIPAVWCGHMTSTSASSAPVACLFSSGGENRQTFACADAMNPVKYKFVLREEDSFWLCDIRLLDGVIPSMSSYETVIRIDTRALPYEDCLGEVSDWWASMPVYKPAEVPEVCKHPVYSTWYSFHQHAYGDEIEEVLHTAEPLGLRSVIVDDGWQMADAQRTYGYCGDWEVSPEKIKDMKAHVERVHAMGMKYFLWYSVPYVGIHSKAWEKFKGKYFPASNDTAVFDPRYPDVREYLIQIYENAVKEWDLDGFKLDFIDQFSQPAKENPDAPEGRDYVSTAQAVDRLMTDILSRLKALKPDIGIEFRQSYIGPLMRKYGNMFRAADCANDTVANKIRTIDIRLLSGNSPAHSDMLTWSPEEIPEAVALQLINTLFSVQQISVRPAKLPESQKKTLSFWLSFWEKHRDTLLSGKLRAYQPELLYTIVSAEDENCYIAAAYAGHTVLPAPEGTPRKCVYVNGGGWDGVTVCHKASGKYRLTAKNCMGETLWSEMRELQAQTASYPIPNAGLIEIEKI